MPYVWVQVKQGFESFMKWLDALVALGVELAAARALIKVDSLPSPLLRLAFCTRQTGTRRGAPTHISTVGRTDEPPSGRSSLLVPFDTVTQGVAVVTTVGQDELRHRREVVDLGRTSRVFRCASYVRRSRQRQMNRAVISRRQNFVAVSVDPLVIGTDVSLQRKWQSGEVKLSHGFGS
jgi:hypothetical protein